jgi:hypothetical protein
LNHRNFLLLLFCKIYLFLKENLSSDGQQFHQYQENEQLPLSIKTMTHGIGNPDPGDGILITYSGMAY